MSIHHQVILFKRQYLQLLAPITYPDPENLREETFQEALYDSIFQEDITLYKTPRGYKFHVLKELLRRIESSIDNWDEQGVSDTLASEFADLFASPLPLEATEAQQKHYATYTLPFISLGAEAPFITILESNNLLLASGSTGFRTWEASLHLSVYLSSQDCIVSLRDKRVLELGSGSGYLSIFCSKYMGVAHMTATDGSSEVLTDMCTNFNLNGLQHSTIINVKKLEWGGDLVQEGDSEWNDDAPIDIILLADVTYDTDAHAPLMATLQKLSSRFSELEILMCATIRNEDTWNSFVKTSESNGFILESINFPVTPSHKQEGPFYSDKFRMVLYILSPKSLASTTREF